MNVRNPPHRGCFACRRPPFSCNAPGARPASAAHLRIARADRTTAQHGALEVPAYPPPIQSRKSPSCRSTAPVRRGSPRRGTDSVSRTTLVDREGRRHHHPRKTNRLRVQTVDPLARHRGCRPPWMACGSVPGIAPVGDVYLPLPRREWTTYWYHRTRRFQEQTGLYGGADQRSRGRRSASPSSATPVIMPKTGPITSGGLIDATLKSRAIFNFAQSHPRAIHARCACAGPATALERRRMWNPDALLPTDLSDRVGRDPTYWSRAVRS